MNAQATFIELVELHERKWGTQAYSGRPSLQALMTTPIVALWTFKKRFIFSVHAKAQDLNDIVDNLVRTGEYLPLTSEEAFRHECRLSKIFVNRMLIEFKIRIIAEAEPREQTLVTAETSDNVSLVKKAIPIIWNKNPEQLRYGDVAVINLPHLPGRQVALHRIEKKLIFTLRMRSRNTRSND